MSGRLHNLSPSLILNARREILTEMPLLKETARLVNGADDGSDAGNIADEIPEQTQPRSGSRLFRPLPLPGDNALSRNAKAKLPFNETVDKHSEVASQANRVGAMTEALFK